MKYVSDAITFLELDERLDQFRLNIPVFHRAAASLVAGTQVFVVPVRRVPEIIITTINPENWGDLWKLEVSLEDKPGAVESVIDTLEKNRANILAQESLSDFYNNRIRVHHLSVVMDLAEYTSVIDGSTHERNHVQKPFLRPNGLMHDILHNSIEYIKLSEFRDRWLYSFSRMNAFFVYKENRGGADQAIVSKRGLRLPRKFITSHLQGQQGEFDADAGKIACHLTSDTEERIIKVNFLYPGNRYLLIRIKHKDEVGAIARFTALLAERGINIVNSYGRISEASVRAEWYCFVELRDCRFESVNSFFRELDSIELVIDYDIRDYYSKDTDTFWERVAAEQFSKMKPREAPEPESIEVAESPGKPGREGQERRDGGQDVRPFYRGKGWKRRHGQVFVAMPFQSVFDEFYQNHVKKILEGHGFNPLRIDQVGFGDPNRPIMDRVKEEIFCSEWVLADVTGANPNVLYEIGLAHSIGRPTLLICAGEGKSGEHTSLFDIGQMRHLFYSPFALEAFRVALDTQIRAIVAESGRAPG